MASTGRRTVNAASVRVAGPIWRTWSSRGRRAERSDATHESLERLEREPRPHDAVADGDQPGSGELAQVDRRERGGGSRDRHALTREEEADEHGEGLVGAGPQPERREPVVESQAAVVADEPVDAASS